MAFRINTTMKNAIVNEIITDVAGTTGTAGTALLLLYSGTQPDTGDDATNGSLLGTIADISWVNCTGGTAALTAAFYGTTGAAGTAGWARMETIGASGTYRLDGDVGTSATCVFQINNPVFATAGGIVSLLTGPIYMG